MDEKKKKRVLWSLQELDQISYGQWASAGPGRGLAHWLDRAVVIACLNLIAIALEVKFTPLA